MFIFMQKINFINNSFIQTMQGYFILVILSTLSICGHKKDRYQN